MAQYFVEKRPDGQFAVLKPKAERASALLPTQKQAIARAHELNTNAGVDVERVRNTKRGSRDQWRSGR